MMHTVVILPIPHYMNSANGSFSTQFFPHFTIFEDLLFSLKGRRPGLNCVKFYYQVRVYTSKNVHEELESAKREFLQASIGFQSDKKVLLPKILEWYAREASISSNSLLDWVSQYLDEKEKETILKCVRAKPNKSTSHCIEWVSYSFNFRYLLERDLASRFSSRIH